MTDLRVLSIHPCGRFVRFVKIKLYIPRNVAVSSLSGSRGRAAKWLSGFRLKGVGLDTLSADRDDSVKFPVHQVLLGQDIVLVENLTNLQHLPQRGFSFSCFPLPIAGGDGCPTRAVGIVE